ncbi:IucA/IucC family C-terminal-domain containing protein [Kushneria marisflavi]|uniref:Aerobactin siderophore biosynthesis IucA/IucC-like C-terminal domain-containing protein n=1 Tax=Kushneria marisflavi TaxID=157779 RepID=A0A240UME2_9GAMM|nr:IucA/IucC family C-terminal-domain containing protein [Kushneria marisflavi]ART62648.1 hypothetical protein B9H00_05940 [Kushneria marisflavi]RKD83962.1 ferric iron reductase protein FhuF [Kushneria marisflavi]
MKGKSDFTPQAWAFLTDTLALVSAQHSDVRAARVAELCEPDRCARMLDQLSPIIGSPGRRVTASLLSKRLGFLLTGAGLYALSACNRALDVSSDNCLLEWAHDGGRWTSSLPLISLESISLAGSEREAHRTRLVTRLFAGVMQPLWQTFHEVSGVPLNMLWENAAVRVYSLYERRMAKLDDPQARARRDEDFNFLLTAPPALFGAPWNPLGRFYYPETPTVDGRTQRFRRTCCLYFKATCPAEYCQSCPLLKPRRR